MYNTDLANQIENAVQNALNTNNFSELNKNITTAVNTSIAQIGTNQNRFYQHYKDDEMSMEQLEHVDGEVVNGDSRGLFGAQTRGTGAGRTRQIQQPSGAGGEKTGRRSQTPRGSGAQAGGTQTVPGTSAGSMAATGARFYKRTSPASRQQANRRGQRFFSNCPAPQPRGYCADQPKSCGARVRHSFHRSWRAWTGRLSLNVYAVHDIFRYSYNVVSCL